MLYSYSRARAGKYNVTVLSRLLDDRQSESYELTNHIIHVVISFSKNLYFVTLRTLTMCMILDNW